MVEECTQTHICSQDLKDNNVRMDYVVCNSVDPLSLQIEPFFVSFLSLWVSAHVVLSPLLLGQNSKARSVFVDSTCAYLLLYDNIVEESWFLHYE